MVILNKLSKVLGPLNVSFGNSSSRGNLVSRSQKLFSELNLTHFNDGVGTLMPILVKSLRKLEELVRKEMREVGALECRLPILTPSALLDKSGRGNLPELFKVQIKGNKSYVLSPTCEEGITHLLTSFMPLAYKSLPIRLYQISTKFRDEIRCRSGLLRSKEFIMKDLYCFDSNEDTSEECYQEIINQYHHLFDVIKVPHVCVEGQTGDIGGLKSHEFFFISDAGQDRLVICSNCGHVANTNFVGDTETSTCQKCNSNNVTVKNAIEVGHAFKLGTRYTEPFKAFYVKNQEQHLLQMSCFGLGLSRILAATVEVLSTAEEIRWPLSIAPYLVCILPPKDGSKEAAAAGDSKAEFIYHSLYESLGDDVIFDDRTSFTIGKRLQLNQKLGFPFQVVIGKNICEDPPKVEVHDCSTGSVTLLQPPDVNQFILGKLAEMSKVESQREKISMKF